MRYPCINYTICGSYCVTTFQFGHLYFSETSIDGSCTSTTLRGVTGRGCNKRIIHIHMTKIRSCVCCIEVLLDKIKFWKSDISNIFIHYPISTCVPSENSYLRSCFKNRWKHDRYRVSDRIKIIKRQCSILTIGLVRFCRRKMICSCCSQGRRFN